MHLPSLISRASSIALCATLACTRVSSSPAAVNARLADSTTFAHAIAPSAQQEADWARDDWRDQSPHQETFVQANGQRLHVLDWGGTGQPIVLLHGMGHTAHIFDALAPRFTANHHVLAITLRGHGASSQPAAPYSVDSIAIDISEALHAMSLRDVVLVGHSLGGHVANRVAALRPAGIAAVVYLDAAKDSTGLAAVRAVAPTTRPVPPDSEWSTRARAQRTYRRLYFTFWSDAQEADFRAQHTTNVTNMPDLFELQDWKSVRVPQLDVCALDSSNAQFPWLTGVEREAKRAAIASYVSRHFIPWERQGCDRFAREAPRGTLVVVPESNHYVFLVSPEATVQAITKWLGEPR